MLQVKAFPFLVGKTINLPHSEHFVGDDNEYGIGGASISFDSDGFAIVTDAQAAGLEEFYSKSCVVIGAAPAKALRALVKAKADKAKASAARHEEHLAVQAGFLEANKKARDACN